MNGKPVTIQSDSHYPLLWALRDDLKLTGTKFGCGIGECAVCLVDVDGKPTHSCITPVSQVVGKQVTTIEGLAKNGKLTAVQQAWIDEQVPQCGWCQSGQIMMAEALLREHPKPTDKDMDGAMFQVLCRCGTYPRIKNAIKRASGQATGSSQPTGEGLTGQHRHAGRTPARADQQAHRCQGQAREGHKGGSRAGVGWSSIRHVLSSGRTSGPSHDGDLRAIRGRADRATTGGDVHTRIAG